MSSAVAMQAQGAGAATAPALAGGADPVVGARPSAPATPASATDPAVLRAVADALDLVAQAYWNVPDEGLLRNLAAGGAVPRCLARAAAAVFASDCPAVALRDLAVDYTGALCSTREGAPYPYESVYVGEGRLLMRPVHDEVRACYDECGYAPEQGAGNEPLDHLATELRFIAFLMRHEASLAEAGDAEAASAAAAVRTDFARQHPAVWVPCFGTELAEAADTVFYQELAPAAVELLEWATAEPIALKSADHERRM